MKPLLAVILALVLSGCAGSSKLTEIQPRIAETTPSPTITKFILRDSVVFRYVPRDTTIFHSVTDTIPCVAREFYVYSGVFVNEHGDSNFVTFDTQTGEGSCSTHFAPVKVPYQDTTHSVTPPPIQQGITWWQFMLAILLTAAAFTVIGKFGI